MEFEFLILGTRKKNTSTFEPNARAENNLTSFPEAVISCRHHVPSTNPVPLDKGNADSGDEIDAL